MEKLYTASKTRPGADCGSDHEHLIAKFRFKMRKIRKTTRSFTVRRPGTKGSRLRLLGLVHWQASWPLSTPSGQDVSLGKEESHQSHHLLQEEGPLPGPETGLLPNTRK